MDNLFPRLREPDRGHAPTRSAPLPPRRNPSNSSRGEVAVRVRDHLHLLLSAHFRTWRTSRLWRRLRRRRIGFGLSAQLLECLHSSAFSMPDLPPVSMDRLCVFHLLTSLATLNMPTTMRAPNAPVVGRMGATSPTDPAAKLPRSVSPVRPARPPARERPRPTRTTPPPRDMSSPQVTRDLQSHQGEAPGRDSGTVAREGSGCSVRRRSATIRRRRSTI